MRVARCYHSLMTEQSQVSFSDLVLMLATMAAVHFGEVGDPVSGAKQKNMPAAGQMIDLLGILQQKTEGRLEPEESQLLETMLYELRLRFIDASKDTPRIITP
jgi:Domain of unknown function (DUF1844)